MKFGDKLIQLRKKNGYSQEELAEKLGVSRQSVSKWESNNTYPETDKIIQIANLFDCSMDDLINDKVTDVESSLRKNKNNIQNVWDSLLEFITKTINMFSKMKFIDGLKCFIEMIILSFLLFLFGHMICGITSTVVANIFRFLDPSITNTIKDVINAILNLIWLIIALIALIYTFKIRYLNQYEEEISEEKRIEKKEENPSKGENTLKEGISEKEIKRDEKPFAFLSTLSKIVILFIKFIAWMMMISTVFSSIGLVIADVITISHISTNIIFLWISLLLLAGTIVSIQIIALLINFIFNKKINVPVNIIIFISCIILSGTSIGLITLSIKNIEIVNDNSVFRLEEKELPIDYKENLVIDNNGIGEENHYHYIINNEMKDGKIIIKKQVDSRYFQLTTYNTTMDQLPVIKVQQIANKNFNVYYKFFIKNLKENKIVTFNDYGNDPLIIVANENTINQLIENTKKLYLVEEQKIENEIDITLHGDKVYFQNGLNGEYNAIDDTIKYHIENYSCKKEIEKTEYGEKIIYYCDYAEE